MTRYAVEIEGIEGRLEVEAGWWGSKLLVDGELAPKGEKGGTFRLARADGGEAIAKLRWELSRTAPSVEVDGRTHHAGPKLHAGWLVLVMLPLALVGFGGALGGACGGLAAFGNRMVAGSSWPAPLKVLAMLGLGGAAVLVWAVVGTAVSAALE